VEGCVSRGMMIAMNWLQQLQLRVSKVLVGVIAACYASACYWSVAARGYMARREGNTSGTLHNSHNTSNGAEHTLAFHLPQASTHTL
jgi:hypothetical protein